jgi:hypothetical protein
LARFIGGRSRATYSAGREITGLDSAVICLLLYAGFYACHIGTIKEHTCTEKKFFPNADSAQKSFKSRHFPIAFFGIGF